MERASEQASDRASERTNRRISGKESLEVSRVRRDERRTTRTSLGYCLARKHLLEEDVASSTESGRIDYPVFHLNTCSLPFTGFLACTRVRASFTWQSVRI